MPPRIPGLYGLSAFSLCSRAAVTWLTACHLPPPPLPWTQAARISVKERNQRMKRDPYWWAQTQQRKAANVKRQEEITKAEEEARGDPVHGIPTPFIESFDSGGQAPMSTPPTDEDGNPLEPAHLLPTSPHILNYQLSQQELDAATATSYALTRPLDPGKTEIVDTVALEKSKQDHDAAHAKAVAVLQRIAALENASAKDRKHANIRRCIDTFGRHNTDHTVPNAAPPLARGVVPKPKPPRAGPDTGSSEVQISILTVKIRALAQALESEKGHRDKNNKRSLRLLVHKRQRLLRYMERKERGSGRWFHMMEKLGLTPATWKGQITL